MSASKNEVIGEIKDKNGTKCKSIFGRWDEAMYVGEQRQTVSFIISHNFFVNCLKGQMCLATACIAPGLRQVLRVHAIRNRAERAYSSTQDNTAPHRQVFSVMRLMSRSL